MSAGDFCEIYGRAELAGTYDAIITCFFVDTAPVVVDYVQVIHQALRPGGVWINFGPLLYHWTSDSEGNGDARYDQSIELSWEELKHVISTFGFAFQRESFVPCSYTHCALSLMNTQYTALFFTATKA